MTIFRDVENTIKTQPLFQQGEYSVKLVRNLYKKFCKKLRILKSEKKDISLLSSIWNS